MLMINQRMNLYLYAYADISIHTQGWTEDELAEFLVDFGINDAETVHDVFRMIATDPAAYLPYTIGNLQFWQMRQTWKKHKGKILIRWHFTASFSIPATAPSISFGSSFIKHSISRLKRKKIRLHDLLLM